MSQSDNSHASEVPGGWAPALNDLAQRRAAARAMGGAERLEKKHAKGQLDARGRIDYLLDPGSFRELGTLVGDVPSDGIVAGAGRIDGRPVMIGAEDFTVLAGSIGPGSSSKRYRIAELALAERIPLIMLLEGAGHRGGGGGGRAPTDLLIQAKCSGKVPVLSAVMGPSAGHGALIVPMSDFSVMTQDAAVFTAGPPVVRESLGEDVTKEDLGGPSVAVPSGLIHNVAPDDETALDMLRVYLSFFPSSAWSFAPHLPAEQSDDQGFRSTDELLSIIPSDSRRAYDMRAVLDVVVDPNDGSCHADRVEYSIRMICADCNDDGIVDYGQILHVELADTNGDGIPDICQGPTCADADIYRDFNVNGADLGILLSQWGPNTPLTESDLNSDGVVNGADLGLLLSFWGACP